MHWIKIGNTKYSKLIGVLLILFISQSIFSQYSVSGKLLDENNDPVSGQIVQMLPTDKNVITAEDGSFSFESISPGKYTLILDSEWWESVLEVVVDGNVENLRLKSNFVVPVDEVVIKSIRFAQGNTTAQTTISKKAIVDQLTAADMPYMLNFTPSVVVTSDAGAGVGYTGMRIRGSDQSRINVTINGIPLNDAESQNVFFVDLPDLAASAQSIQVQRGVGTSSYGAASFGASVNVNTHDYSEKATTTITGLLGSFNTQKIGLQFNTGKIGTGFYLGGRISQITSDGYIDRATSDLKSIALSPTYFFGESSLRYDLLYGKERTYQAWYGIDTETLESNRTFNPAGNERPVQPYPDQVDDYQQVHHQLHFNTKISEKVNLGISTHYTPGNGFYEEYKAGQSRSDYGFNPVILAQDTIDETDLVRRRWLDNHFYGVVGSVSYDISEKSSFILGGGWNHYKGQHFGEVVWAEFAQGIKQEDRYYDNEANKYDGNIYAKYLHQFSDNLSSYVDLQYRTIKYEFEGPDWNGALTDQSDKLNFFNPKIGINYRASDQLLFSVQSGIAQKEPNRDDYTESSPASRPRSEWLWDTEVGARWQINKKIEVKPNFYYMKYKDQLALTGAINDVGAATRINVDDSYRVGVEIEAKVSLTPQVELSGNISLSSNRIKSLEQFVDSYDAEFNFLDQQSFQLENTHLPFSPEQIGFVGLNYSFLNREKIAMSLFGNVKYVGSQFIDLSGDENNRLDAYQTLDLGLIVDIERLIGKNLRIKFDVLNVQDEKYSSNAWSYKYLFDGQVSYLKGFYPQALRNYHLTLMVTF